MATGFGSLFSALGALRDLALPEVYEPTADEQAHAILADVKDRYGVYQEGWPQLADATILGRAARGETPNDPLLITGGLRDANTYSVDVEGTEVVAWIGIPADDPHAIIAAAQEFGTMTDHPIPPRPVLGPAAAAHEGDFIDSIEAVIGSRIIR